MSFVLPSVQAREGNSHMTDTVMRLVCVYKQARWCDHVFLSHTHTHNTQNSAFEQSITNTSTNNKTYLQLLIQKRQIIIAKLEFTQSFFRK